MKPINLEIPGRKTKELLGVQMDLYLEGKKLSQIEALVNNTLTADGKIFLIKDLLGTSFNEAKALFDYLLKS